MGVPLADGGGEGHPNVSINLDPEVLLEQLPLNPVAPLPVPRRVKTRKHVDLARWDYTSGCPSRIAAETGASLDHSEECRKRNVTAMHAGVELEARVTAADHTRHAHQDGEGFVQRR